MSRATVGPSTRAPTQNNPTAATSSSHRKSRHSTIHKIWRKSRDSSIICWIQISIMDPCRKASRFFRHLDRCGAACVLVSFRRALAGSLFADRRTRQVSQPAGARRCMFLAACQRVPARLVALSRILRLFFPLLAHACARISCSRRRSRVRTVRFPRSARRPFVRSSAACHLLQRLACCRRASAILPRCEASRVRRRRLERASGTAFLFLSS